MEKVLQKGDWFPKFPLLRACEQQGSDTQKCYMISAFRMATIRKNRVSGSYFLKYLLRSPSKAFPCLASSRAIYAIIVLVFPITISISISFSKDFSKCLNLLKISIILSIVSSPNLFFIFSSPKISM